MPCSLHYLIELPLHSKALRRHVSMVFLHNLLRTAIKLKYDSCDVDTGGCLSFCFLTSQAVRLLFSSVVEEWRAKPGIGIDKWPHRDHCPPPSSCGQPSRRRRSPDVDLMLDQRRRRWANVKSTSGERLSLAVCNPESRTGSPVEERDSGRSIQTE